MGMTEAPPSLTKRMDDLERRIRQLEFLLSPTKTAVTVMDTRKAAEGSK